MRRVISFIVVIVTTVICLVSCSPEADNDNSQLYGSEWSSQDETEGVKFFKDDTVLFFTTGVTASGTFEYDKTNGVVSFDGLVIIDGALSAEFTQGYMVDDKSMYLIWHPIGRSDTYRELVYKRR